MFDLINLKIIKKNNKKCNSEICMDFNSVLFYIFGTEFGVLENLRVGARLKFSSCIRP